MIFVASTTICTFLINCLLKIDAKLVTRVSLLTVAEFWMMQFTRAETVISSGLFVLQAEDFLSGLFLSDIHKDVHVRTKNRMYKKKIAWQCEIVGEKRGFIHYGKHFPVLLTVRRREF